MMQKRHVLLIAVAGILSLSVIVGSITILTNMASPNKTKLERLAKETNTTKITIGGKVVWKTKVEGGIIYSNNAWGVYVPNKK